MIVASKDVYPTHDQLSGADTLVVSPFSMSYHAQQQSLVYHEVGFYHLPSWAWKLKSQETSSFSSSLLLLVDYPNHNNDGHRDCEEIGTRDLQKNKFKTAYMFFLFVAWCCMLIGLLNTTINATVNRLACCVGHVVVWSTSHPTAVELCTKLFSKLHGPQAPKTVRICSQHYIKSEKP